MKGQIMIRIYKAGERGHTHLQWLDSRHSFSFGDYYDPARMSYRSLRVINDDRIAGGGGFGMHPHRDMEILTFVVEGALEHKDSLGHAQILRPGEVQRMSAGTGIWHSEHNASRTEPVHLFQIWIQPDQKGLPPEYEQKTVVDPDWHGLRQVVGPAAEAVARIHQDAAIYLGRLRAGEEAAVTLQPGRHAWVQVMRGAVDIGEKLARGDGAAVSGLERLHIRASEPADLLVFDLA